MIVRKFLEVGDKVIVTVPTGGGLGCPLHFNNNVLGTENAPPGRYLVEIIRVWHDYETGYRAIGRVKDRRERAALRMAGTTTGPTNAGWDPGRVYLSGEVDQYMEVCE